MSDLDVVALLKAKPGSEIPLGAALAALVEPTRQEAGCVSYELFESQVDASTFVTVEKWRSQADLDTHMQSAHVQHALAVATEHLAQPPAIHPLRHR